ncbi:MAG: SpoVA/SpoVAEb family sporulation membrane protein [Clostridiales bacterium]|jgi:stage V sporulation protein AE|nr:SpoVA/SpoVAEb family sporulation membrane protein [Clostridiales bacterium]
MITQKMLNFGIVFLVGGGVCALAQLLIIKTKLTPARILIIFMFAGVVLQATGAYQHIYDFAKFGISLPIVGFGAALTKGAIEYTQQYGILGAFAGGLVKTAFGVGLAVVASYLVALLFKPKAKR